jgi:hypothetical protein
MNEEETEETEETERERVINLAYENHEIVKLECGTWYYWPSSNSGAPSSRVRRWIATELARLDRGRRS